MSALDQYRMKSGTKHFESAAKVAIRNLLLRQPLCAIACIDREGKSYINTAYFVWDPAIGRLYFLSDLSTNHAKYLAIRPNVSVNVFRETRHWGDDIAGIQLFGVAKILDKRASETQLPMYCDKFPEAKGALINGLVGEFQNSRLLEVTVEVLKVVDMQEFGDEIYVELHLTS